MDESAGSLVGAVLTEELTHIVLDGKSPRRKLSLAGGTGHGGEDGPCVVAHALPISAGRPYNQPLDHCAGDITGSDRPTSAWGPIGNVSPSRLRQFPPCPPNGLEMEFLDLPCRSSENPLQQ